MKKALALGTALVVLPSAALAQNAADYSPITGAVDWTAAIAALMTVGAAVGLVLVARKGIKVVLGMIR